MYTLQLLNLLILLRHSLHRLILPLLKHSRPGSLFHHTQNLPWFHVEHFCDLALHNQEVWVIDIKLDGLKEVLKGLQGGFMAVQEVL